jgi:hypothetical protein
MADRKTTSIQGPWVTQFMAAQFDWFIVSHSDLNAVFCSGIVRQNTLFETLPFKRCKFTIESRTATEKRPWQRKYRLGTQENKRIKFR